MLPVHLRGTLCRAVSMLVRAPLRPRGHLDNTVPSQCWAHKALTGTRGPWGVAAFTSSPASAEGASGKQRKDPQARSTVGSVGRRIHQRHLQVIGASGEDLGTMHRADVIRLMDREGLKLVAIDLSKEPPIYRLMTGKQIHEEQLKLREKQKNKAGPVLLKELNLFTDIGPHDLHTKLRQVQNWLERRHHVRVTLKKGSGQEANSLDEELEKIVQRLPEAFSFISKPQFIQGGKAAFCILRTASKKSLQQLITTKKNSLSAAGTSLSQPHDKDHPLEEGQVTSPEQ